MVKAFRKEFVVKQSVCRNKSWAEFFLHLGGCKDVASVRGKHLPYDYERQFHMTNIVLLPPGQMRCRECFQEFPRWRTC